MKKLILLAMMFLVSLLLIIGCAMERHKKQIKDGLLTVGLNRNAFLTVWGMPDKTYVIKSDAFSKTEASSILVDRTAIDGFKSFTGSVPLDVWEYKEKEVTLIFNGIVLVGWKTEKTRKEILWEAQGRETVYVSALNKDYHRENCPALSNSSKRVMSLKEAKSKGYTSCHICK
jgi:hypothetical protein